MSVGLYKHPILGETKKFILNNKNVLSIKTDTKLTGKWVEQYQAFKNSFLKDKKIKFYLLPEDIYVDRQVIYKSEQINKVESMRIIVYQHFVVTLKEELQTRIKGQELFSKKQLWFMLYTLTCGVIQMLEISEYTRQTKDLQINPENILLSEYGYIKLVGYYSIPFPIKNQNPYRASQSNLSSFALPQKAQVSCSAAVARIVSSLALLKQLDQYIEIKQRLFSDQRLLQQLKAQQQGLGIIYDILRMMLNSNFHERLMAIEVKAMLLPYQDEILTLKDFTFDRQISRESMILLFEGQ